MRSFHFVLAVSLSLAGCYTGVAPHGDGGGSDLGPATDMGTGLVDLGPGVDAGHPGTDGGGGTDAHVAGPGCDPVSGIECDGDWTGRCTPACGAGECCSPQHGDFTCAPRDAAGNCPAADLFVDAARIDGNYT